jgi:two-component system sensor histidine kinase/response regulator
MTGTYDPLVVALSMLVAVSASYAALDLAGRVTAARGRARAAWTAGGAAAMGIGIWSMHFIGMLAFSLPVPVRYHWPTVMVSLLVAILASAFALYVVSRKTMRRIRALGSGVAMGIGIAGLHYINMTAMRLAGITYYNPLVVALSILFAIGFSFAALLLAFYFRNEPEGRGWRKIGSALVMGAAIFVMHYTGMAAARFVPSAVLPDLSRSVSISSLETAGIITVTLLVLGLAMLSSLVDRRFDMQALELALAEVRIELARIARIATMGELTASIAHEINQPLAAVVTNASASLRWLALQPPNLDEARAAATRTVREANRAGEVIGRIRALLKKEPPQMGQLQLNEVIQQVLALSRHELARAGITVQTELAPEVPALHGDRVQLQQVMLNLIMNAIDAMAVTTDGPRKLLIKSASVPEGVLVQVQDFGQGVVAREAERIFEPFFTTKPQGIGMGLSISRSIIEAHGGQLWVTPGSPHGAVFQFILPKAKSPQ